MKSVRGSVLIVDDSDLNRALLTRALQEEGHAPTTAENGEEALTLLRANGGADFDIVLLDIIMPRKDGYATLAEMQNDAALRHLPVIMISALDEMESVIRCIELGATDYLLKPFNATLLRARINSSLEKKRLHDQEQKYLRALERELEIGREIQASFLPAELPQPPGWEIAARFQPAREVAGDFFDAFELEDGARVGLVVADVCDKGVGAALFMALCRTLVRALAQQNLSAHGAGLERTVEMVNDYVAQTHSSALMYATLFFGVLDPRTGWLQYVNAGHNLPAVLARGKIRSRLGRTGPAIGILQDARFDSMETRLEHAETLLAFTDGVTDALSPEQVEFTEDRLLQLAKTNGASAAKLLDTIQMELQTHMGHAQQFDDITLLAAHYKGR